MIGYDLASVKTYNTAPGTELVHGRMQHIILSVGTSAASCSACFGLIGFYFFVVMDHKHWRFRHSLIVILIVYDFIKVMALLAYDIRVFLQPVKTVNFWPFSKAYVNASGWFTAFSIEGADMAILAFAIHTCLAIYRPDLAVKVKKGSESQTEGGLYRFKAYVYLLCLLIPVLLASLMFIDKSGYFAYTSWAYIPPQPVWYTFALSWAPRYAIMIMICVIYGAIYWHVMRKFKEVGGTLKRMGKNQKVRRTVLMGLVDALLLAIRVVVPHDFHRRDSKDSEAKELPGQSFDDETVHSGHPSFQKDTRHSSPIVNGSGSGQSGATNATAVDTVDLNTAAKTYNNSGKAANATAAKTGADAMAEADDLQENLRKQNLRAFKARRNQISRQLKFIFIYPVAYIFLWIIPFILHVTQSVDMEAYVHKMSDRHTFQYWITIFAQWMQSFNCTVDVIVFLIREQPWRYSFARLCEEDYVSGRYSTYPREVILDPAGGFNKAALLSALPWWRQQLVWLPLLGLPDFGRSQQIYQKQMTAKLVKAATAPAANPHDFSNILSGEDDFLRRTPKSDQPGFRDFSFRTVVMDLPSNKRNASVVSAHSSTSPRRFVFKGGSRTPPNIEIEPSVMMPEAYFPSRVEGHGHTRLSESYSAHSASLVTRRYSIMDFLKRVVTSESEKVQETNIRSSVTERSTDEVEASKDEGEKDLHGPDSDFLEFLRMGPQ